MNSIDGDRRRGPRVQAQRPCKIYDPHGRRYLAASTLDMSSGGLLIDVPRLVELRPGEALHVGVAVKRREALLRGADMIQATVVRALPTVDDHTIVAVRFDDAPATAESELSQAA